MPLADDAMSVRLHLADSQTKVGAERLCARRFRWAAFTGSRPPPSAQSPKQFGVSGKMPTGRKGR